MSTSSITNNIFCFSPEPIRLGEFDLGGVLYHSNYFHIYEQTREAFLRSQSFPYSNLVQNGQHLALVESHQRFHKAVEYDMEIKIKFWCDMLKRSSLRFNYLWETTDAKLVHEAWTRHAFVQSNGGKLSVSAFPETLRQLFQQLHAEPNSK